MLIRFLQTTPSGIPGYPFQAGQTIRIDHPSPEILSYLDGVTAEVVKTDAAPERAVASEAVEVAVAVKRKPGRPRKTAA